MDPEITKESLAERERFERSIDKNNRWAVLTHEIHWGKLIALYGEKLDYQRIHPTVTARSMVAALIVKYKLKLSSSSTIRMINENQYLQYFTQLGKAYGAPPLTAELMRSIRDLIGKHEWEKFKHKILNEAYSTPVSRLFFALKQRLRSITLFPPVESKGQAGAPDPDKQLYTDLGLEYSTRRVASNEKRQERKRQRMKKRTRRVFDVVVWTILILLVTASLVMIITESEWTHRKKTEKSK